MRSTLITMCVILVACSTAEKNIPSTILAEVGTDVLTHRDVKAAIPYAVWQSDSLNATSEYVRQWTMTRVLAMQAEKLGLHELREVADRIRTHRDDVLIETLRDRAIQSMSDEIHVSDADVEAYYQEHSEQFALKERHVRIRHLTTVSQDMAIAAKSELQRGGDWIDIVNRYAADKPSALASSDVLRPVSSLVALSPFLQSTISSLKPEAISSIREFEGRFQFVQLLETHAPGTIPDVSWVKDRILEWLTIEKRRVALLSFEQSLLLQAQADGTVRNPTLP